VLATLALGFHLYHGAWSSMRTLGLTRASANPLQRRIPAAIAVVVTLGFLVVPLAIAAGLIREQVVDVTPAPVTASGAPAPAATTAAAPTAPATAPER